MATFLSSAVHFMCLSCCGLSLVMLGQFMRTHLSAGSTLTNCMFAHQRLALACSKSMLTPTLTLPVHSLQNVSHTGMHEPDLLYDEWSTDTNLLYCPCYCFVILPGCHALNLSQVPPFGLGQQHAVACSSRFVLQALCDCAQRLGPGYGKST